MYKTKINILHLISSVHLGGAEIVAFNISDISKKGSSSEYEFSIAELFSSKGQYSLDKKRELESKNIRIRTLSFFGKRLSLLIAPFSLLFLIIKEKPQIIHSHTDLPDFVLANTIRLLNFFRIKHGKIVRTIHNTILWPNHLTIGKYTENALHDDYIAAVSEASLNAYIQKRDEYHLKPSEHYQVIYNGCSLPTNKDLPFKLNNKKINIAFCGRFEYQKGIDILIERIKEINKYYNKEIQFYLIGDGIYRNKVSDLVKHSDNVAQFDPISNISNKLHAFDFIIMPSRFEGLVLLSIEASLAKVPVIASDVPGLSETLPEDWPLLFNLSDPESLFNIFRKIIGNELDLNTLKNKIYTYATNKFALEQMKKEYEDLYTRAIL